MNRSGEDRSNKRANGKHERKRIVDTIKIVNENQKELKNSEEN